MTNQTERWLTRKEAAAHLRSIGVLISPRTLSTLAQRGKGPPYQRVMHRIAAYNLTVLEEWAKANTVEVDPRAKAGKRAA